MAPPVPAAVRPAGTGRTHMKGVPGSAAPRAFSQAGNCSLEKGCTLHQFIFSAPSFLPSSQIISGTDF